jgi:5-(carboxyamino)imidazole ribonucleotide synthase
MEVGILGGGQLGRMLALAGYPLGVQCAVYDPAPDACAGQVAPLICAPLDDADAIARFAQGKRVITYEFENVPVSAAWWASAWTPVRPTPRALELFQDRLLEKQFLREVGVPTPAFAPIDPENPADALEQVGCPCVVKTRHGGYDGKGQRVAHTPDEYLQAVAQLGGAPLIAEAFVPFNRELSAIGVRGRNGEMHAYPLVQNHAGQHCPARRVGDGKPHRRHPAYRADSAHRRRSPAPVRQDSPRRAQSRAYYPLCRRLQIAEKDAGDGDKPRVSQLAYRPYFVT